MTGFDFFTKLDQTLLLALRARTVRQAVDKDKDIFVRFLSSASDIEINALQRGSAIILQKSLKESLDLTLMLFLSLFEEGEVV